MPPCRIPARRQGGRHDAPRGAPLPIAPVSDIGLRRRAPRPESNAIVDGPLSGLTSEAVTSGRITIRDLHAYFGKTHVVKGISMNIPTTRITAIIGRNRPRSE